MKSYTTLSERFNLWLLACIYVCTCMYVCVCVCVCMYVYVCICMYMHVYVCICMYMYVYVIICMYMYVYVCICMYVCIGSKRLDSTGELDDSDCFLNGLILIMTTSFSNGNLVSLKAFSRRLMVFAGRGVWSPTPLAQRLQMV